MKIREAYFGEDHKEVAITLGNLGNAYGDLGDASKKRDLLERALKIKEAYFGEGPQGSGHHLDEPRQRLQGTSWKATKLPNKGISCERALKIKEAYFGQDHLEVAITLSIHGNAYEDHWGCVHIRGIVLQRELEALRRHIHFGEDASRTVAIVMGNLGNAYGDLGDASKKRDLLERALKIKEAYFGKDHKEVAITLMNLGMTSRHILEGYEAAMESCERALMIFLKTWSPEHPRAETLQRHIRDVLQKHEASAHSLCECI